MKIRNMMPPIISEVIKKMEEGKKKEEAVGDEACCDGGRDFGGCWTGGWGGCEGEESGWSCAAHGVMCDHLETLLLLFVVVVL